MIISPSILSVDFGQFKQQLQSVENSKATWIHFDVMDGHFVKNISFGPDILKAVRRNTTLFADVHLVLSDPEYYADVFIDAGADSITFHLDAIYDVKRNLELIRHIKSRGIQVGITLRPQTSIYEFSPYLSEVDLVLVMSIEPGFGGQSFQEEAIDKIAWLYEMREKEKYKYLIQVDGGINEMTSKACWQAGADVLVAGSYVFHNDIIHAVESLVSIK